MIEKQLDKAWTWLGDKLQQGGMNLLEGIYNNADYALVLAIVLLLFVMFGSKRAGVYLYWTFACYIITMFIGGVLL